MAEGETQRKRGRPRTPPGQPTHRRQCEQISYIEAANFVQALHFARNFPRPDNDPANYEPNLLVTIQWKHAPSTRPAPERIRRLLNNLNVWLRRRAGLPSVWAYSREVGKLKGEHLHLMAHVPQAMWSEFRRKLRGWIEMETTGELLETAIRVDPIRPGDVQRNLKSYFLKDGTAEVRDLWVKPHHKATGGKVAGKRIKVSHAIGPTARRKATEAWQERVSVALAATLPGNPQSPPTGAPEAGKGPSKVEPSSK